MKRAIVACCALVLASGCLPRTFSTNAVIFNFERVKTWHRFRVCSVRLGWSKAETVEACGVPQKSYPSANDPESVCWAYESVAHTLASNEKSAPYVVACFSKREIKLVRKRPKRKARAGKGKADFLPREPVAGAGRGRSAAVARMRAPNVLTSVHGVSELPKSATPPAAKR